MKESIHKYFKLGTLQWMSFPNSAPLDALTAIARDDFFDAVEIKSYGAEKEQAKAILDQSHLTVAFGAHPMQLKDKLNPNALDESERQKAEDALKGAIDEAAYLGATAMAFLAGHWDEATKEQAYRPRTRFAITRRKKGSVWSSRFLTTTSIRPRSLAPRLWLRALPPMCV